MVWSMAQRRDERVFLVRMWQERQAPGEAWRGFVQEVSTGRKLYVTGPHEVAHFIAVTLVDRDDSGKAP